MEDVKPEFWERAFTEKNEMWGFEPSASAIAARDLFLQHKISTVLIPGIGYGRNAQLFMDSGMSVTGIEISKTAIELARKHFGETMVIHHGSVADMPFDAFEYGGVFCHALIHLLGEEERRKLILDCYRQLLPGGYMVFSVISKTAATYGTGKYISADRYELYGGVRLFFYDRASINEEFCNAGLIETTEIQENFPFFLVICRKPSN